MSTSPDQSSETQPPKPMRSPICVRCGKAPSFFRYNAKFVTSVLVLAHGANPSAFAKLEHLLASEVSPLLKSSTTSEAKPSVVTAADPPHSAIIEPLS
ncbi:hypothetical protein MRX96_020396 [Rhipicephalus microplus]